MGFRKQKEKSLFSEELWEAIEITEGKRTWWEVRRGALTITDGYSAIRYPTAHRALNARDAERNKDKDKANRIEKVLP